MNSTYLIESEDSGETIGLFQGNYQYFNEYPEPLASALATNQQPESNLDIKLTPFITVSEVNELAEFRILNFKDRVIVRFVENNKSVIFGRNRSSGKHFSFDIDGVCVVRGPVLIQQFQLDCDGQMSENRVKYSGLLTLNISGFAFLDLSNPKQGVRILLPTESKYGVERTIPYRFQQKNIVQRQKDKFQAAEGMMSLEMFDYLLQ